jgi:serine/threonine-protein kinase
VFVGESDRERQLYLREIDSLEVAPIPGTEDADAPFFSPDSQWVAFFAENKLKKVSLTGGPSLDICDVQSLHSSTVDGSAVGSWGPHDTIVTAAGKQLLQVSSNGGEPEIIATIVMEDGEYFLSGPEILPGGKAVLYTALNASCVAPRVFVQSLETGERKVLIDGGSPARYTPSGHLVYAQEGSLLAVPFDLQQFELNGPPTAVLEGVMMGFCGDAHFSISKTGSLAYVARNQEEFAHTLVWVDRNGNAEPVSDHRRFFFGPRLSPDRKRLAIWIGAGNTHVWIYEMARGILTKLTSEGQNFWPLWTLDGGAIVFPSIRTGEEANLYSRSADGSGLAERLTESDYNQQPLCWSPDGKLLVIQENHPATGWDIWVLPMEGEREARPFLSSPFNEFHPALSPDGRWLAYVSNESGRDEIYVTSFPQPGGRLQISTEGGTQPAWAPSGAELFYRNGRKMMAVDIATEPELTPANPRLLFEGRYHQASSYGRNYDITPDGQLFIMVKPAAPETAPTQLHVVLNWSEELKRLVPPPRP